MTAMAEKMKAAGLDTDMNRRKIIKSLAALPLLTIPVFASEQKSLESWQTALRKEIYKYGNGSVLEDICCESICRALISSDLDEVRAFTEILQEIL